MPRSGATRPTRSRQPRLELSTRLLPLYASCLAACIGAGQENAADHEAAQRLPSSPAATPALRQVPDPLALHYRIDVRLLPAEKRLRGKLKLTWRNVGSKPLDHLLLHQYLNAFSSPDTLFMRESAGTFRHVQADPEKNGWIRLAEVRVGGAAATTRALHDGTVLRVDLPHPLAPGQSSELSATFEAALPRLFARTGYADEFFMVAQWYPKLGFLRRDGSWHCPPFHANSEFFARFARFDVTVTLPPRYEVGATGVLVSTSSTRALKRLRYSATGVHDFAFSAWPHFRETRARLADVNVRLLSVPGRSRQWPRLLSLISHSLRALQGWFGPYPYPQLTVVDVPAHARGAMGMEYPTLFTTWLPAWAPRGLHPLSELTVHELTHQYFQGIVATNEADEPWLDEGLTSFVSAILLDELFGAERSFLSFPLLTLGQWSKSVLHQLDRRGPRPAERARRPSPVAWPAAQFGDWRSYASTVYGRATTLLYTIDDLIGRERMRAALASYVRENAFRHPTGRVFRQALLAHTPPLQRRLVRDLLAAVLDRSDTLDYRVRCLDDRIVVQRLGKIALPLTVRWRGPAGAIHAAQVSRADASTTLSTKGVQEAWLGPPRRLGLDEDPLDNRCVLDRPAARALSPFVAGLQQLVQLLLP